MLLSLPFPFLFSPCPLPFADARGRNNVWADFMNMIEPVASAVPWMVNCGNHDCLDPNQEFQPPWLGYMWAGGDGGECGKAYNARLANAAFDLITLIGSA